MGPRGTLRLTIALTAAYIIAVAMLALSNGDPKISPTFSLEALAFSETLFAAPMVIATALASWLSSFRARQVLLGFALGYILLTLSVVYSTFAGEQDAQYQLQLLEIPMLGLPALSVVGAIAWSLRQEKRS